MPIAEGSFSRGHSRDSEAGNADPRGEPLPGAQLAQSCSRRARDALGERVELWERPRPRAQRLWCGERLSPGSPGTGPAEGAAVSGP